MTHRFRRFQRKLLAVLLAFGGVSLLTVCADVNGPSGRGQRAHVAFQPVLAGASVAALGASSTVIDNVRIIIRNSDGIIVLDTVVTFPVNADELSITADIPVQGDSERFQATIQLRSGEDVLFEGTQDLTVRPGAQAGPPPTIPVTYIGTGANAATLTLSPGSTELVANGTQQLVATVRDANGDIISGVPLGWTSSDDNVATVSPEGAVAAKAVRGTALITATTFGGVSGSMSATVVLPPSELRVAGGGGQTARVSEALPFPFVVEVLAADGVGVANVAVSFGTANAGASITPATATTDENGRASATMTLGTTAGLVTFHASAAALNASVNAVAVAGDPNHIVIEGGNAQSALTGTTLPSPLSVRVTDEFGNPGAGRQVNWVVVTAGSLGTASSTTNAAGIATNTFTLPASAGEHVVSATLTTGGGVSFTATALPRPASSIVIVSGGAQTGVAGTSAQPLIVRAFDSLNQPVANAAVTWTVAGTASIGSATTMTNSNGFASVSATFGTAVGTSTVTAAAAGAPDVQFALTSTAGPPANMNTLAGDNQSGAPGDPVAIAPSVQVTDAFGNPIAGVAVTFGSASGGGFVLDSTSHATDASGVATSDGWVLGGLAPVQTMTASGAGLTATFTATVNLFGTPAGLIIVNGDGQIVTPLAAMQPMIVEVMTAGESPVPGVTVKFDVLSGSATPTSVSVVSDANGHATFTPTAGAALGAGIVQACVMPACTITTHISYNVIAGGSIWLGTAGPSWFTPANWSTGNVPGATDNVFIQGSTPNFPVVTAVGAVANEFFMASGSIMNLGVFDLQIGSSVNTTGAFVAGTGSFVLTAASAPLTGSLPNLQVLGTVIASGPTTVNGNLFIAGGGRVDIGPGAMTVSGGLTIDGAGRLTMNNAAGTLTINGDAFIAGQDMGDTELTAGLLEVKGNFTAAVFNQAFRAAGTHTTKLSGTGLQTINFFLPGSAFGRFQNLQIVNTSANGVTMSSNVFVEGALQQGGRLTVASPFDLSIGGTLTLGAGSNTDVTGTINFDTCDDQGGAHTGFSCFVVIDPAQLLRRRR